MTVLNPSTLRELDWNRDQNPTRMVRWSHNDMYGRAVRGSLRHIAHLDTLNQKVKRRYGSRLVIIQPAYNKTVEASAGTHDYDAVVDLYIPGVGWWEQQRFLRLNGMGCWYRHPPKFGNHIHGFTLPPREGKSVSDDFAANGFKVGLYVPGQLFDYYNHAYGLAGMHSPGSDNSWFPANIEDTIFNLGRYIRNKRETDMEYKDWSQESKNELQDDIFKRKVKVATASGDTRKITVTKVLQRAATVPFLLRATERDIKEAIEAIDDADEDTP